MAIKFFEGFVFDWSSVAIFERLASGIVVAKY
jgi:hypothetical protein